MGKGLIVLAGFTSLIYILVTLFIPVPLFIKYENVVYASLYIVFTYLALRKGLYTPLLALTAFNTGRLSRSIVTSRGEIGEMTNEHIPLLILLVIYMLYVAYLMWREKSI